MTSECRCGRPTRDQRFLCDHCRTELDRALGDCRWVDTEIDTTITRQRAIPPSGGGPASAETGLPWHERAARAKRTLHSLLVLWVRFCGEEEVRGVPGWQPTDRLPSLARWLLHCTDGLTLHDIAPDAHEEITDAVAECQRIVFYKRRGRTYLGPCGQTVTDDDGEVLALSCPGEVYAEEGHQVGHCDECGQGVTVVIRRGELERRLDDQLCTAAEIARLSTYLGLDVKRERVRQRVHYWARHGRILSHGRDDRGDPTYRYGEVRTMLYAEFATRESG